MKNAKKFNNAKYNTLTQHEWDELERLINRICDAHNDDKWWKVDNSIRACVNHALMIREADEEFAESLEEEEEGNEDED